MTFDGVLIYTPAGDNGRVSSYTHFLRTGILETVTTSLLETRQVPEKRLIPHVLFEGHVLDYLPRCFESLQQIGVRPPVSVSLTLIGVKGLRMAMGGFTFDSGNEIREDTLVLRGTVVESFSAPVALILKPMFDRVWNACGLLESPNFDKQGLWSPRRGT